MDLKQEQRERAYDVSLDTRKFEISLFWTRSLFFWGFIASAFGGFVALRGAHPTLAMITACFGVVCAYAWTMANRGSKYWQENWEQKVAKLERQQTGSLFRKKEDVRKEGGRWLCARRYSVSRLTIALSDFVLLVWAAIAVAMGAEAGQRYVSGGGIKNLLTMLMPLAAGLYVVLMWRLCRSTTWSGED